MMYNAGPRPEPWMMLAMMAAISEEIIDPIVYIVR